MGHFVDNINSADLFFVERFSFLLRFKMYCKNDTGSVSCALSREVYYTVSLLGGVH